MMSTGRVILALGLLALLAQAYALTGRAPDPDLMHGLGPVSLTGILACEAIVVGVIGGAWARQRRRARGAGGLAALCLATSLAALGILLRHPLSGAFEFPHRDDELAATRLLLLATALLLGLLGCWPTVRAAIDRRRAAGDRGAALALGLARDAATQLAGPLANLGLSVGAIAVTLVVGEAAIRIARGVPLLAFDNLVTPRADLLARFTANDFDPVLGWVLAPNRGADTNGAFTTGAHGVRMNGKAIVPVPRRAILAVGDSFTAGSEVINHESWPALLEVLLGEPVVNAGVGGYASDQIVLRAETLLPALAPQAVIVSFFMDDILRAGYATYGGANKPYFTVADGALVAHNNPVPRFTGSLRELGVLRRLFGFSHLAAFVARALDAEPQWVGGVYTAVDTDPVGVACKLLERLGRELDPAAGLYFILQHGGGQIALWPQEPRYAQRVVACAQALGIPSVDVWDRLRAIHRRDPAALKALYVIDPASGDFGHMSAQGNALMAEILAELIATSRGSAGRVR